MRTVLKKTVYRLVVIVLIATFALWISPSEARAYTLSQLVDPDDPNHVPAIEIDNLRFSGFKLGFSYESPPFKELDPQIFAAIEVQKVEGENPGLKFTGFNDTPLLSTPVGTSLARVIVLSYTVESLDAAGSPLPLIQSSILSLEPGTVATTDAFTGIRVQDEQKKIVYREKSCSPSTGECMEEEVLKVEANFPSPQVAVFRTLDIIVSTDSGGEATIQSFEQRVSLAPAPGSPVADAGPDQIVADQVTLNGGGSSDPDGTIVIYDWKLKHRENPEFDRKADGVNPEVSGLQPGFYDVDLTVTDDNGNTDTSSMLLAAAGASVARSLEANADMHVWKLKLKQYKYWNWGIARMVGTVNLPKEIHDLPHREILDGNVTIVVDDALGEGEPLIISAPTRLKVRNRSKYKTELRTHWHWR